MASWSSLPPKMHHEIIKQMDFITRFRFRLVSKTSQYLVDSVPFYIPMISFEYKKGPDEVTLIFYFGVPRDEKSFERMVRLEFKDSGKGLTQMMIGTKNYFKIKTVPSYSEAVVAARVLKHIAMHPRTLIGTLCFLDGWRIGDRIVMQKVFKSRRFRAKTLHIDLETSWLCVFCKTEDLLEVRETNLWSQERELETYTKRLHYRTLNYNIAAPLGTQEIVQTYQVLTPEQIEEARNAEYSNDPENLRQIGPNDYCCTYETELDQHYKRINSCGLVTRKSDKGVFKVTVEDCEMRFFCEKHTDPLEFWYYNKLFKPMRQFNQNSFVERITPKFDDVGCGLTAYMEVMTLQHGKLMGEELEEDLIGELKHDHEFDVMEGEVQQQIIADVRVEKKKKKKKGKWLLLIIVSIICSVLWLAILILWVDYLKLHLIL